MQFFLNGSPVPHAKAPANPLFTGRPSQQLAGNRPKNRVTWKFRLSFRVARASRSSSHVGGMSEHALFSPVVLGCACWWLSLVWLGAGASGSCPSGAGVSRWPVGFWFFRFPFSRAPTRGPERGGWLQVRNTNKRVSRRSCMVQNSFRDGAAMPCQVVTA